MKVGLQHEDFAAATRHYTDEVLRRFREQPAAIAAARATEVARLERVAAEKTPLIDLTRKSDHEYTRSKWDELLRSAEDGAQLTAEDLASWAELFKGKEGDELRRMSWAFQCACWRGVVARAGKKLPRGAVLAKQQASQLFGSEAAWSERSIKEAVKASKDAPGTAGRPNNMPKELEDMLVSFVKKLRQLRVPVYRETVWSYAMRLLSTHVARPSVAQTGEDGDFVRDEAGGLKWDLGKLEHWYYRHFIGVCESLVCVVSLLQLTRTLSNRCIKKQTSN